ncbi:dihydrofolate reductase family protein [Leucobacter tenebrionis]|uniref:dihydrofolate reductase family protein n=1 Tax=Leucobacter tenebrionis TaxID=2873270 RepID=UPI001CA64297|nr:dihydrofolate reductase family protein [Leucobacter tenebrionis]QZY51107.1 dihydrofolate reductase family protein [Leucobacter tenebrionis]
MTENAAAGRIVIDLFTTLDGVAQAPGAPDEDPAGGFRFGGWQAPHPDDMVGRSVMDGMHRMDALLLGRRTYDIFAEYWPQHGDSEVGRVLNALPKYVATRNRDFPLGWPGSTRVGDDLPGELARLRERHDEVHVIGSIDLVQTLVAERLFDELKLWVYPIVLGEGSRVFPDGAAPTNLRLIEPPVSGSAGAVLLRYAPEAGSPETGTMDDSPEA